MNNSPNDEEHESENVAQPQIVNAVDDQHIINRIITEKEIQSRIHRLKNHKTPGPDNILNEYIKMFADILMPSYLKIFKPDFFHRAISRYMVTRFNNTNPQERRQNEPRQLQRHHFA